MARVAGGVGCSHVPAVGAAIDKGRTEWNSRPHPPRVAATGENDDFGLVDCQGPARRRPARTGVYRQP